MWLRYGIAQDNSLVPVENVKSGKTSLRCPYCDGGLTAKKGRRKEHHFAHTGETCQEVNRSAQPPNLPLYDNFNIYLTGKELEQLKLLWDKHGAGGGIYKEKVLKPFIDQKLLEYNPYTKKYYFTKLGKIPVRALSLMLFNEVHEVMLLKKLQDLEGDLRIAYLKNLPIFNQCLRDLQIYQAEFRKILSTTLYYIKIDIGEQTLYKIGVTHREVETRIAEINNDLAKHFQDFSIKVLGTWAHRGNVEKYFKYKYSFFNIPIGNLTEYYNFFTPEQAKAVLSDLRRMRRKGLSATEVNILEGIKSEIEQLIEKETKALKRSQAIKTGMERAKKWGQHIGRPPERESPEEFLAKPSSQRVIAALNEGLSLRSSAKKAGVAVNTVRKVQQLQAQHTVVSRLL